MNDTYFSSPSYDETARSHVVCQEIGHLFGLDHQDEAGADLNTCMDYDNNLSNAHPNQHDYQMLEAIYEHLDTGGGRGGGPPGGGPPGGGNNGFENANVHPRKIGARGSANLQTDVLRSSFAILATDKKSSHLYFGLNNQ